MSTIFTWLANIKLTLEQTAFALMAGAIGLLVVAFELQGSKLHKTQVSLLQANFGSTQNAQDVRVKAAFDAFKKARDEYEASK